MCNDDIEENAKQQKGKGRGRAAGRGRGRGKGRGKQPEMPAPAAQEEVPAADPGLGSSDTQLPSAVEVSPVKSRAAGRGRGKGRGRNAQMPAPQEEVPAADPGVGSNDGPQLPSPVKVSPVKKKPRRAISVQKEAAASQEAPASKGKRRPRLSKGGQAEQLQAAEHAASTAGGKKRCTRKTVKEDGSGRFWHCRFW